MVRMLIECMVRMLIILRPISIYVHATLLNYYHYVICIMGLQGIVQMQPGVLTEQNRCYDSFDVFCLLESRAENELFYDNTHNIFAI